LAAGVLGLFLGGLGLHRFYLGYVGIGIVQIIVTLVTLGAGALWGMIEGILILAGSINKDAQGQPLRD
jgi:TM2 domain-containing membrane protein YozV